MCLEALGSALFGADLEARLRTASMGGLLAGKVTQSLLGGAFGGSGGDFS